jgi:hypothetical protein
MIGSRNAQSRGTDHSAADNRGYRPIAIAVSVAFVLATTQSARATDSYRIYLVEPVLSNHAIRPAAPLPATCKLGNSIKIMAARGEYEPASFLGETELPLLQLHVRDGEKVGRGKGVRNQLTIGS